MDFLKSRAPFWKKEFYGDKDAKWLDPKPTDEKPEAKWLT
jgi:molybdopterin synthase catalytic subunit